MATHQTTSTRHTKTLARLMLSPAVALLLAWMLIPLCMTIYFSFRRYLLLRPEATGWVGFDNYEFFLTDPLFEAAIFNTLYLVSGVLAMTVIFGVPLALLLNQRFFGRGIVRLLAIAPFFIMPTVSALVWKNMMMHPVNGVFAWIATSLGMEPVDWFGQLPLTSITLIVAWQWLPFATLIILTALQSLDREQQEAAEMDGAGKVSIFRHITLPHLSRAIAIVILIETIFILGTFAEIFVTTNGGPASSNLTFLIYEKVINGNNPGLGSAGGVIAIILANIVALFLLRIIGKSLET